ncbi:MAG: UvrD-helicase domain-containing protein [Bacilli bacterium]|jgi:hypothetical protein
MRSKNIVKLSAAGSGKTWGICNDALSIVNDAANKKKVLITTYTNKGIEAINQEIKKQNFGVLSERIVVRSWYRFLLYDLIRPYQSFITGINTIKSFDFNNLYGRINYFAYGEKQRYINSRCNILANYASELAIYLNSQSKGMVIDRLEKIYSHIFIDEIQDMAGNDLDIIDLFMDSDIITICVGDNKQATYKTHNTQKRKKQAGKNVWMFFTYLESKGKANFEYNLVSRRFNQRICQFANYVFPNESNISACMGEKTDHDGVFLILKDDVFKYYNYFKPIVLRYDKDTITDGLPSLNFGQCKGMTFDRVLIYPNKTFRDFIWGKKLNAPQKYYVAVTRPRYSIAIVLDEFPNNPSYQTETIRLGDIEITAKRFSEGETSRGDQYV